MLPTKNLLPLYNKIIDRNAMEMIMKNLLLITATSLSLITSATIFASIPHADICPSVSAIQSIKFYSAIEVNGTWTAEMRLDNFDTKFPWYFSIEGIYATNESEAIKIGNEKVKSLSFLSGPTPVVIYYPFDSCLYTTRDGNYSSALHPLNPY